MQNNNNKNNIFHVAPVFVGMEQKKISLLQVLVQADNLMTSCHWCNIIWSGQWQDVYF